MLQLFHFKQHSVYRVNVYGSITIAKYSENIEISCRWCTLGGTLDIQDYSNFIRYYSYYIIVIVIIVIMTIDMSMQ